MRYDAMTDNQSIGQIRSRRRLSPEAEAKSARAKQKQRRYRANHRAGKATAPHFLRDRVHFGAPRGAIKRSRPLAVEIGEALVRAVRYVKFD
jgi:hypothetical protein